MGQQHSNPEPNDEYASSGNRVITNVHNTESSTIEQIPVADVFWVDLELPDDDACPDADEDVPIGDNLQPDIWDEQDAIADSTPDQIEIDTRPWEIDNGPSKRQYIAAYLHRSRPPSDDDHCSICLEAWNAEDQAVVKNATCPHFFHKACIIEWFNIDTENNTCPLCRSALFEKPRVWKELLYHSLISNEELEDIALEWGYFVFHEIMLQFRAFVETASRQKERRYLGLANFLAQQFVARVQNGVDEFPFSKTTWEVLFINMFLGHLSDKMSLEEWIDVRDWQRMLVKKALRSPVDSGNFGSADLSFINTLRIRICHEVIVTLPQREYRRSMLALKDIDWIARWSHETEPIEWYIDSEDRLVLRAEKHFEIRLCRQEEMEEVDGMLQTSLIVGIEEYGSGGIDTVEVRDGKSLLIVYRDAMGVTGQIDIWVVSEG